MVFLGGKQGFRCIDCDCHQVSAAGKMTNAAILAGRVLLILLSGCMDLTGGCMVIVLGSVMMKDSIVMQDVFVRLCSRLMAVTIRHLNRDSGSQRVAAEQWQPNRQKHRNKLFKWEKHVLSLSYYWPCCQTDLQRTFFLMPVHPGKDGPTFDVCTA